MPGIVLIGGAHRDFMSGVVFGQGVGAAVGTINRIAVAQPLVLHVSGYAVVIANGSGQRLPDFGLARDVHRAFVVRGGRGIFSDGIGRTAFHRFCCAFAVGIGRFNRNGLAFFRIGQGVARTCADFFAVGQPVIGNVAQAVFVGQVIRGVEGFTDHGFACNGNAACRRMVFCWRRCGVGDGVCSVTEQVFLMPRLVVVIHLHTDDFADIGGGDGIAAAVRAVDRRSVCQPGVLDAVRQAVAIANVRSQGLADGGCAAQGDLPPLVRAAVIAAVYYGGGRADDAFHFAGAIGIGDAHADNFAAVIRCDGVGLTGCAADLLAGSHPLVTNVADSTVAIADSGVQNFAGRGFAVDGGHSTVVSRAGDFRCCRQVDVIGDDTRIFGIKTDSAAGVGIFIIGKGGNHLAVDADFHGVAALRDDKIFGLRQRPAFAAGRHEALTAAVSRVTFAEFPAISAGNKIIVVVVIGVIPHEPCRFPSIGCRALAQLFRGGDGAAISELIPRLHGANNHCG